MAEMNDEALAEELMQEEEEQAAAERAAARQRELAMAHGQNAGNIIGTQVSNDDIN